MLHNQPQVFEYIVIGAGPAAITAIPNLLNTGVKPESILWLDPAFKVGDFGTKLSHGSSVPGNTTVENYQKVNKAILGILAKYKTVTPPNFEIDTLAPSFVCTLKTAAQPLQFITNELRSLVPSVMTKVSDINETIDGLSVRAGSNKYLGKRVIVATGSQPRTLNLPALHVENIEPNVAFIKSEIQKFIANNPDIKTVAVIGSSHSAALATMHLLELGLSVKQFMDKEYKYAVTVKKPDNTQYTQYDNTGLKGDVAKFTKSLLADIQEGKGPYKDKLQRFIAKDRKEVQVLLAQHLNDCTHAVAAIGYTPTPGIKVNGIDITTLKHNNRTTAFDTVRGLFGIGIAYPQQVTDISGEIEMAVGVGKFWSTANNPAVQTIWRENSTEASFFRGNHQVSFFKTVSEKPSVVTSTLSARL